MKLITDNVTLEVGSTESSGTEFVSLFPRGVYTTFRTVHRSSDVAANPLDYSILCLQLHVERIYAGYLSFTESEKDKADAERNSNQIQNFIRKEICSLTRLLISEYRSRLPNGDLPEGADFRVYVQARPNTSSDSSQPGSPASPIMLMNLFIEIIPDQNPDKNEMILHIGHRTNPNVKDTAWITKRKGLENLMKEPRYAGKVNEVVLYNEVGNCFEGISSNFFVITKEGVIQTAPKETVLVGSIRQLVFRAAEELGVEIDEKCPSVKEMRTSWAYTYVTSTSRKMRSLSKIYVYHNEEAVPSETYELGENRTDIANSLHEKFMSKIDELIMRDSEKIGSHLNDH